MGGAWKHLYMYWLPNRANRGRLSAVVRHLGYQCPWLLKRKLVAACLSTRRFWGKFCHHCSAAVLSVLLVWTDTRVAPVNHLPCVMITSQLVKLLLALACRASCFLWPNAALFGSPLLVQSLWLVEPQKGRKPRLQPPFSGNITYHETLEVKPRAGRSRDLLV